MFLWTNWCYWFAPMQNKKVHCSVVNTTTLNSSVYTGFYAMVVCLIKEVLLANNTSRFNFIFRCIYDYNNFSAHGQLEQIFNKQTGPWSFKYCQSCLLQQNGWNIYHVIDKTFCTSIKHKATSILFALVF